MKIIILFVVLAMSFNTFSCDIPESYKTLCNAIPDKKTAIFDKHGIRTKSMVIPYIHLNYNQELNKELENSEYPLQKLYELAITGNSDAMVYLSMIFKNKDWKSYWLNKARESNNYYANSLLTTAENEEISKNKKVSRRTAGINKKISYGIKSLNSGIFDGYLKDSLILDVATKISDLKSKNQPIYSDISNFPSIESLAENGSFHAMRIVNIIHRRKKTGEPEPYSILKRAQAGDYISGLSMAKCFTHGKLGLSKMNESCKNIDGVNVDRIDRTIAMRFIKYSQKQRVYISTQEEPNNNTVSIKAYSQIYHDIVTSLLEISKKYEGEEKNVLISEAIFYMKELVKSEYSVFHPKAYLWLALAYNPNSDIKINEKKSLQSSFYFLNKSKSIEFSGMSLNVNERESYENLVVIYLYKIFFPDKGELLITDNQKMKDHWVWPKLKNRSEKLFLEMYNFFTKEKGKKINLHYYFYRNVFLSEKDLIVSKKLEREYDEIWIELGKIRIKTDGNDSPGTKSDIEKAYKKRVSYLVRQLSQLDEKWRYKVFQEGSVDRAGLVTELINTFKNVQDRNERLIKSTLNLKDDVYTSYDKYFLSLNNIYFPDSVNKEYLANKAHSSGSIYYLIDTGLLSFEKKFKNEELLKYTKHRVQPW